MVDIPVLKDWRGLLEKQLGSASHSEQDLLKIVRLAEDLSDETRLAGQWLNQQAGYLSMIVSQFSQTYALRFNKQVPPRPPKETTTEILLDNPEQRKKIVREVALAVTKPGDSTSDEAILEELKRRGMKLVANNPTATIATILKGFKPQFQKVKEKRGVFIRQE
jgi:hypothetical protein